MSLLEKIKADRITAIKAKNSFESTVLGTLIGEVQNRLTRPKAKSSDEETLGAIKASLDAITENLGHYTDAQKIADETAARDILLRYQPTQLTADELAVIITKEFGTQFTQKERGPIMQFLKANYAGQYDGQTASNVVVGLMTQAS